MSIKPITRPIIYAVQEYMVSYDVSSPVTLSVAIYHENQPKLADWEILAEAKSYVDDVGIDVEGADTTITEGQMEILPFCIDQQWEVRFQVKNTGISILLDYQQDYLKQYGELVKAAIASAREDGFIIPLNAETQVHCLSTEV